MDGITEVYLPVSHQRLLVGSNCGNIRSPSSEELNLNSVELSHDFFVARRDSPNMRDLIVSIGKRAMLYDPEELKKVMAEAL
jgi:hypothetical protein